MTSNFIPSGIAEFTEYIEDSAAKLETSKEIYEITPEEVAAIVKLVLAYTRAAGVAGNPATATTGARRARDEARAVLEPAWREFLNEHIRYNSKVPVADLEVFRIKRRDTERTPEGVPDAVPTMTTTRVGTGRYEVEVLDGKTGKKKRPAHAAGSVIYMALTAAGEIPHAAGYRKMDFSSNCHHVLEFSLDDLGKQASFYARYVNAHGKEGPMGAVETVVIG
jgi:hypothetical protein